MIYLASFSWIGGGDREHKLSEKIPIVRKRGIVTALYKGGRKQDLKNYRGITLNSSIHKLFTRILRGRMEEEVEGRGTLREIQFGFRKSKIPVMQHLY